MLPRYRRYCTGSSLRPMRARGRGRRWPEGSRASHGPFVARIIGQGRGDGRHRDRRGGAVGTAIDRQGGQGQARTTRPLPPDCERCIRYRRPGHRRMGDGYWWRQHARRCCAMRRGRWTRRLGQHGQLRHGAKSAEGNPVTAPRPWLALTFGALLVLAHPHLAAALGDTDVKAGACSVASGGNATKNTITCNFGLTPEQLREATKAAVAGATSLLLDRIDKIRNVLGVTRSAAEKLLKIAGEQPDVPDEKLAEGLTSVAADYQRLKAQAAALSPDNLTARVLVAQAKAAIEAGQLAQAHVLLRQATQVQIAAAQEARKLDWAGTQMNLGNALESLGERES